MSGKTISPATYSRIIVVMALIAVAVLVLVGQLIRWQVIERDHLLARAEEEHRGQVPDTIPAQRGFIYDRDGSLLGGNLTTYDVGASPDMMKREEYRTALAANLAPLLDQSSEDVLAKINDVNLKYVYLAFQVPQATAQAIEALGYAAVKTEPRDQRVYPQGTLAAHMLGFVFSDKADHRGYSGAYGVEGFYDSVLRGQPGVGIAERDPLGAVIPVAYAQYTPPANGKNLVLTIHRTAQRVVERELQAAVVEYQAEGGTVVVLEPHTGAILAMASQPAYDPNRYAQEAAANPDIFTDPAISLVYEPGSVVKIVTVAAALDSGTITPDTTLYDAGAIEVGGSPIRNWDNQAHGTVDITTVLGLSLNVGSAQTAVQLGAERFYTYVRRFGFGNTTGVDLYGEVSGSFKTPEHPKWSESDLGRNSFGQAIDATPLQVASAIAAIANGGLLMRPYVVQAIVDGVNPVQTAPKPVRRVVTAQTAHAVTRLLETVVEQYTTLAQVPGYRVAGKSGTSQVYVPGGYHPTATIASFVGYVPSDDPAMLILVVIKRPKASPWGGQVAAPVFSRIAKELVVLLDVPPDAVRRQAAAQPVVWSAQ
jgi:cell division protein FtsI/penicillin-binding protein 2